MNLCDGGAILAFALDGMHGVTCSEVRQLRDDEAASEAEAMERWLDDGGKSNFEKIRYPNFDESQPDRCSVILEKLLPWICVATWASTQGKKSRWERRA
jgi:hypothetical protein